MRYSRNLLSLHFLTIDYLKPLEKFMNVSNLLTAFQIEVIERVSSFKENRRLKKAIDNLWLTHIKEQEKEIIRSLEKSGREMK